MYHILFESCIMSTIYRSFLQNKLWRNKAIMLLEENNSKIDIKHLTNQEFDEQLRIKLKEECEEVVAAYLQEHLIEEIADVYEVIDTLCSLHTINKDLILKKQLEKRQARGTFMPTSFVTVSHHLTGSYGEQYCLKDPLKYPEIEQDSV